MPGSMQSSWRYQSQQCITSNKLQVSPKCPNQFDETPMHRPPAKQAQEDTIFQVKTTRSQVIYKWTKTSATLQEEVWS